MTPILTLTMRQLAGSRRIWLVLVLVALPVLFGVLFHVANATESAATYADDITSTLVASGILPLVMLLFGTSAFGNEIGDRTLVYLVLKPLPRWKIVAPKMLASLLVGGLPVALSGVAAVAVIEKGDLGGALATGLGLLAGAAVYAAVFTWAGLATRHALLFSLLYVFIWEAVLAAYLDGIRFLSIRRYTLALIDGLSDDRLRTLDLSLGAVAGAVCSALVIVVFSALAVRKLARIDVP